MKPIPEEALRALPEGHYAFWGSDAEMVTAYEQRKATLIWSVGKYRPSELQIGYYGNDPANLYARPLSMKPGRVEELERENERLRARIIELEAKINRLESFMEEEYK